MARNAWIPVPLRLAVEAACAEIERRAPRYMDGSGSYRTEIMSIERRTHSTNTLIRLVGSRTSARFHLKTLVAGEANRELKRSQIIQEYSLLEDLSLRFQPYEGLGVITPTACWPDRLSMLTEEFPGETLEAVLGRANIFSSRRTVDHAAQLCRLVGRWLDLFQTFTKPMDGQDFDMTALLRYSETRLRLLRETSREGLAPEFCRAVRAHCERLASQVEPSDLNPVGRQYDFRPENIMTDGRRIAVLDFTGFSYGPPLYDAMKFWMKLEDLKFGPLFRTREVARWQQAFLEGYGHPVDLSSPICCLLRIANVLDKMSELVAPDLPPPALHRRFLLGRWYRTQRRWLAQAAGAKADLRAENGAA